MQTQFKAVTSPVMFYSDPAWTHTEDNLVPHDVSAPTLKITPTQ